MSALKDIVVRWIDVVRAALISPEVVVVLIIALACYMFPAKFDFLGTRFRAEQELWKYLALLPGALFVWVISESFGVLFPAKESNRAIVQWPDFWRLKYRVYLTCGWTLICCLGAAGAWIMNAEWSAGTIGFMYLTSLAVSFVSAASMFLAKTNVRQIVEELADDRKK